MKINHFTENHLTALLNKIIKNDHTCLLMGDFNINLINTDTNQQVSDFFDNMSSHHFAPYILQPTRIAKNSKTLIDNIF